MDSWLSWMILLVGVVVTGVMFARYAMREYDRYIYNRRHGWQ